MNPPLKNLSREIEFGLLNLPASSIVLIPARLVGRGVESGPSNLSNFYFTFEPIPYFEFIPDADGDDHRIRIYSESLHCLAPYNPELKTPKTESVPRPTRNITRYQTQRGHKMNGYCVRLQRKGEKHLKYFLVAKRDENNPAAWRTALKNADNHLKALKKKLGI